MESSRFLPSELLQPGAEPVWRALEATADLSDPAALARVRRAHPGTDPGLVAAIATQVDLRRRALPRLGTWSQQAILDDEAVQQASRADVASYRAEEIATRWGIGRIADIGCGIGADARALAERGFSVMAIERDPWRAEAAQLNLAPLGVDVICADVTAAGAGSLEGCDMAYVDPARRRTGGPRNVAGRRARPLADPETWSPAWSWVRRLSERMPVVAKVAPGFDPRHAPSGASLEWIDHDGQTVEVTVWLGDASATGAAPPYRRASATGAAPPYRRATSILGDAIDSISGPADSVDPGPTTVTAAALLIEPSPAVVRAGLIGALAYQLRANRLDGGSWLTADHMDSTTLGRSWRVIEEVPRGQRALRAWLRGRGSVTWKTADAPSTAADWERRVDHRPGVGDPATVVITGQGRAFAVERMLRPDAPVG